MKWKNVYTLHLISTFFYLSSKLLHQLEYSNIQYSISETISDQR